MSVTILEPTEELKIQTSNKAYGFDFGISVDTIENFYENPNDSDVLIIDEFDYVLINSNYKVL
jgi:hypothetical protein